jgi:hypothetical protein
MVGLEKCSNAQSPGAQLQGPTDAKPKPVKSLHPTPAEVSAEKIMVSSPSDEEFKILLPREARPPQAGPSLIW